MIEAILQQTEQTSVIAQARLVESSVELGKNVTVHVRDQADDRQYTVKVLFNDHGVREFEILTRAHAALGNLVPKPVWGGWIDERYLLICDSVPNSALNAETIIRFAPKVGHAIRRLTGFLVSSAALRPIDGRDMLEEVRGLPPRLPHTDLATALEAYLQRSDIGFLDRLSDLPQHSDLAINNLGISVGSDDVLVFDWEDFGEVTVPGFDIAVLVSSVLKHDPERLRDLRDTSKPVSINSIVDAVLCELPISRGQFWRMMPIHMCLFVDTKHRLGYAPEVVERLQKAALTLLRPDWSQGREGAG